MAPTAPEFDLTGGVADLEGELVATRRDLHQHPELGFGERRTAGIVARRLGELDIEHQTGIAHTGVVGLIRGERSGKTLMIRADMDALPLREECDAEYCSTVEGAMHACGHDGHVAMLLGAARVLSGMRDRLNGQVKLCFQPAEEGPGGAEPMIAEGVLRDPVVDAAIGIHLWNGLDIGQVGVGTGPVMAATDQFTLDIEGVGGHGALPADTVDPVLVASQIVVALQSIVARNIPAVEAAVVTVGTIEAGTRYNIIPRTARLTGTLRSFQGEVRARLIDRVRELAEGIAGAFGARTRFALEKGYPETVNDAVTSQLVCEQAAVTVGADRVLDDPEPCMGAEDMSYYLREVPGTFIFLGSRNPDRGLEAPHHSPHFDFDEAALPVGVDLFVRTALRYLEA